MPCPRGFAMLRPHISDMWYFILSAARSLLHTIHQLHLINDVNPSLLRTSFLAPSQGESAMLGARTRLGWASLSNDIILFIRRRLRFDLLKTCLISLRGFRGIKSNVVASPVDDIDLNLINWWSWVKLSDQSEKIFLNVMTIFF